MRVKSIINLAILLVMGNACGPVATGVDQLDQEQLLLQTEVTRDLSGATYKDYAAFKAEERVEARTLGTRTLYRSARIRNNVPATTMALIVNRSLYPSIRSALDQYVRDIEGAGYTVRLHLMDNNGSPEDLKAFLTDEWQNHSIGGAFLVGNLPIAWFETVEIWYDRNAQFPCDYYYMDLDGSWSDSDNNGVNDIHAGNYKADIWVARVMANNLTYADQSEAELINNYFAKNHAFRVGSLRLDDKAFTIINKDWKNSRFEQSVSVAYPDNTVVKDPVESVTADAYRTHIRESAGNRYETLLVAAHSYYRAHSFYSGRFYSSEIETIKPQVHFYNLFACSGARFTESDSLGLWYAMQSKYGLNVVGATKTGSMLNFNHFYTPISQGESLGQAFLNWYQQVVNTTEGSQSWYYGNVMIGDPTLKIGRFMPQSGVTNKTYGQVYLRGTANSWNTSALTLVDHYTWQIEIEFGSASDQRFKFDIHGDWSLNFGDNNQDGIGDQNGADIQINDGAGRYRITFHDNSGAYTVEKQGGYDKVYDQVYFRGTPNNWGSSAMQLVADHTWKIEVSTGSGADERFKFDVYGDWSLNFGDNNQDGIGDQNGADILFDGSGTWEITFNDQSRTYTVIKKGGEFARVYDQVYFRGTPNNWGISAMTLTGDNTWSLSVSFPPGQQGEFKFDVYGDWSLNFGDNDRNGVANQNGANIPVSSGNYRIVFNDSTRVYSINPE